MEKIKKDEFVVLRTINKNPMFSQRDLAQTLGFSLGKLNYCIKVLKNKGLIKIQNFKKNKKKINYFYYLTPKGISTKIKISLNFMKSIMKEYDELKNELKDANDFK